MYNILYDFWGLNKALFIFINYATNVSILPGFLAIISDFFFVGNFPFYYFSICLYFYFKLKKIHKLDPSQSHQLFVKIYNKLFEIGMCYTAAGFIYAGLKFGVNLPRPFCSLKSNDFTTILDITNERCLSSFPSAHTALAVMITYYLLPYLRSYQKIIALAIIFTVAVSRITLAMHYPADILYSFIIILAIIWLNKKIFKLCYKHLISPLGAFIYQFIMS